MEVALSLRERIHCAETYFATLAKSLAFDGRDQLLAQHVAGELSLPESMVLISPLWYEEAPVTTQMRRSRTFAIKPTHGQKCESQRLWGYTCTGQSPLNVDHYFPFALGGPTVGGNALFLCREHNLIKGHDVHMYEWSAVATTWLADEIQSVSRLCLPR